MKCNLSLLVNFSTLTQLFSRNEMLYQYVCFHNLYSHNMLSLRTANLDIYLLILDPLCVFSSYALCETHVIAIIG